VTSQGKMVFCD